MVWGGALRCGCAWVPACAGMTDGGAGMTDGGAGRGGEGRGGGGEGRGGGGIADESAAVEAVDVFVEEFENAQGEAATAILGIVIAVT